MTSKPWSEAAKEMLDDLRPGRMVRIHPDMFDVIDAALRAAHPMATIDLVQLPGGAGVWIPVTERVPPAAQRVLVWFDDQWMEGCRLSSGMWFAPVRGHIWPTHWCEIQAPEAP